MADAHAQQDGTTAFPVTNEASPEQGDSGPIPDVELHRLMVQARQTNDAALHRLIVGYLALRRVTADLVSLVAAREGAATVANTPLFRRARDLAATTR